MSDDPHTFSRPEHNLRFIEQKMAVDCQFNIHIVIYIPQGFDNF